MGSLCTQKMLATAPQIARATLGRATPLAHPNAPSQALYGPAVARPRPQPQKRSTCVLPTRPKASWDSFARKRCSQRQHLLDNARNSRGRTRTARPSKCVISCVRRARSGAPTHTTAETPRARALNMQRRITGSLCTQTVCARNMLHLKTLGRETNLSSTKILHIERHTGREWRIHPHVHKNTPHAYFGPAQTPPWTPLHSKRAHNIRHLRERAHLLDERATSRSSKCIISSAAPVLSGVLMHPPVGMLRTRALAMPKACREPFAVIWSSQWHLS